MKHRRALSERVRKFVTICDVDDGGDDVDEDGDDVGNVDEGDDDDEEEESDDIGALDVVLEPFRNDMA